MIEQVSNAIAFYAFFTASKVGKTGLTVTIDVHERTQAGVAAEIITGGSATELADGLYFYELASGSVDATGEYIAVFKTADATVDQQHIPAIWVVGRAGIEKLDAALSTLALQTSVDDLETRLTATRAGYLDNLSGGAAALQSSVDDLETRLTATRAGYLDNLSGGAVALQSSVDDLETRLTATRAGYLDNLSAGAVALDSTVAKDATVAKDSTVAKDATVMKAASYTAPLSAADTRTAVGLATANLDTQLGDLPTNAELTSALAAADDAVLAAIAALNNLSSAGAQAAAAAALLAYNTAIVGSAMTLTAAYDAAKTAASAADVNAQVVDVLRVDLLPDSYAAHEAQPTIAQALLAIHQFLMEREVSSTTMTVQKPDGTSTAMTLTLDSATAPTKVHRSA